MHPLVVASSLRVANERPESPINNMSKDIIIKYDPKDVHIDRSNYPILDVQTLSEPSQKDLLRMHREPTFGTDVTAEDIRAIQQAPKISLKEYLMAMNDKKETGFE